MVARTLRSIKGQESAPESVFAISRAVIVWLVTSSAKGLTCFVIAASAIALACAKLIFLCSTRTSRAPARWIGARMAVDMGSPYGNPSPRAHSC